MAAANACDGGRDHRPLLEYGGVDDLSHPSASLCATQTKRTQAQERLSTYPRRGTSMTPAFCETTRRGFRSDKSSLQYIHFARTALCVGQLQATGTLL